MGCGVDFIEGAVQIQFFGDRLRAIRFRGMRMTGFDGRDDGGLREEMLRGGELLELVQEALLLQLLS